MPTPTIPNGETQFFVSTYTGNGGGQRVGKFVPFDDSSGGTIANSCIFNDDDNAYLSRTFGTPTNNKKWTFSAWVKLCALGGSTSRCLISSNINGAEYFDLMFTNGNVIKAQNRISSSNDLLSSTSRTFEDTSKFYHVVVVYDSDNSTSADRYIVYVDGDRQTVDDEAGSGVASAFNKSGVQHQVGISNTFGSTGVAGLGIPFDGYMAEVNFVDGQALTPASFGLTDSSTNRWIPAQVKPHPTTTTTYLVTVVGGNPSNHPYYNVGSTNKFAINGSTATADVDLTLYEGGTYRFDQSDSSNSGHPLRFSTVAHGTHASGGTEYTTNVTVVGTPGTSGAYTEITVASSAPDLHYYCSSHNGMGYQGSTPNGYGANGFRLTFSDSSSLGADTSGNSNTFTATNLASTDQTTNSPTQNHATLSSSRTRGSISLSEGNLKITSSSSNYAGSATTFAFSEKTSQGFYFEVKQVGSSQDNISALIMRDSVNVANLSSNQMFADCFGLIARGGGGSNQYWLSNNGSYDITTGVSHASNDYIQVAFKEGKVWYGINNTWILSGNPSTGANPTYNNISGQDFRFLMIAYQNNELECNFGQKSFNYTPPTGFVALQQDNLPETAKGVSGFVWVKNRDQGSNSHGLIDSSRGARKNVFSNSTSAEQDYDGRGLTKFLKGGYSCGEYQYINGSGDSLVSWNWVANGGSTASSTNSTVQVNSTSKFSIVQYNGTGSDQTIGHGLGVKPDTIWVKCVTENSATGAGVSWRIWQKDVISLSGDANSYLRFDSDDSQTAGGDSWGDTAPTSSVFTVGADVHTNASVSGGTAQYIAYCFANVDGYFKTGKYVGNSNSDGVMVNTGFKPAFLMIKAYNLGSDFQIWDNVRSPNNPIVNTALFPNLTNAEGGTHTLDLLSNGFKLRSTENWINSSSYTYVYWAFAEHPFVGDGTSPVTAR